MKKSLIIFLIFFFLLSSSISIAYTSLETKTKSDPTVYITRTGKKYHRSSCSSLRKSKIAIRLSEAKDRGYGPCKRCKPPK